eukprot:sb/3462887/
MSSTTASDLVRATNFAALKQGHLKVLYNNVQGLVRTGHLDSDSPPLDMTKVGEIQGFIYMHKYDIIILNETWLKPKISSNCIFPRNFKIYRIDRSEHSHPHDPTNPKKFRRNGGGVLIAHREDLDVSSFRFSKVSVRAELLSILLSFPSGKKLCISTMYRVGNLGSANFESFKEHFDSLFQNRKFCMHVMIGDFNFSGVNWPEAQPRSGVEELFLSYLMGDLGHSQYINSPTHCKVVISNVSILNPGPRHLKVLYNNVQGLVRTGHLDSDSPPLDMTKVGEIQGFIYMHKYDIIILNETWLKPKISSNCIFPRNFKIYRIDRSEHSHPHDPTNPKKFRRNGGGVLIAHREDLDVSSFRFSKVSVRAELLSILLSFPSGKKLCISTMYRVGNLGSANFESFKEHFDSLFQNRKFCMHVMIGDFNFSGVNWPEAQPRSGVEELFLSYLMGDLGHSQYINSPTHCKGNTLDLLFSNDPRCVSNIDIHDQHELCLSDHFAISFNINFDVKRTTIVRRKIKCYDLANWEGFNADLSFIKWKMVLSGDIHSNWDTFHSLIDDLSETHIPTKITKPSLEPLGRDMEWEHARKRKENLRQRANRTGSESDLSNFKAARASLKRLEDAKLRGSLDMDNRDSVRIQSPVLQSYRG